MLSQSLVGMRSPVLGRVDLVLGRRRNVRKQLEEVEGTELF